MQLKGGLPTIAVRDLAIQRRENDLVVGTFGRGIYILDDYTPLRQASAETLAKDAVLFPVEKAWMFIESTRLGLSQQGFQGHSTYLAPNPPVGAVFTYYLKDGLETRAAKRKEAEKKTTDEGGTLAYPSWEELRAEDREEEPTIVLTVAAEDGTVIRRLTGPSSAGIHRVSWDFRFPAANPTNLTPPSGDNPFASLPLGPLAAPGTYVVSLARRVEGKVEALGEPQRFEAVPLGLATLPAADPAALLAFQQKTARLQRAVLGAIAAAGEAEDRLNHLKKAIDDTPGADPRLAGEARVLLARLADLQVKLTGDPTVARRSEPTTASISDRVQGVVYGHWTSTANATATHRTGYDLAARELATVLPELAKLIEIDLAKLEADAEAAGAPWTPGRVPRWKPEG